MFDSCTLNWVCSELRLFRLALGRLGKPLANPLGQRLAAPLGGLLIFDPLLVGERDRDDAGRLAGHVRALNPSLQVPLGKRDLLIYTGILFP